MFRLRWLLFGWLALARASSSSPLTLHDTRATPYDLEVRGLLAGVPSGASRFVRRADLRALPTNRLQLDDEFVPGRQEVTVVFLSEIWHALPIAPTADTLLAVCGDGYAGYFPVDFLARYRPFLVLEINGEGPERWPPKGLDFNPGPFAISVSPTLVPAVAELIDLGHKKPWSVTTLEVANLRARFRPAFSGAWSRLSPRAEAGRTLWLNSCTSCHRGPGGMFGGEKSARDFTVLEAYAKASPTTFKRYVRDPKSLRPDATMEPHPHYSEEQLDALIAFIVAEPASR